MSEPTLESVIAEAAAWLRAEAAKTPFGSVGVVLVLHKGRVARVERSVTTKHATETGDLCERTTS